MRAEKRMVDKSCDPAAQESIFHPCEFAWPGGYLLPGLLPSGEESRSKSHLRPIDAECPS
jgi:hypothetical protein